MMLTKEELLRYQRQIVLEHCTVEGQLKLKKAKVVVVGAGGLGIPAASYLAAAGIGHITIIDHDTINISNLHRQVLYSNEDVGQKKVTIICQRLSSINPLISIVGVDTRLRPENAQSLLENHDIIIDATDNFSTRYLINDISYLLNIPLVSASILRSEGQLTVLNYQDGPSYRCLFPEPPKDDQIPNCSQAGVFGYLPAMIGAMQANEAVKIILAVGKVLRGTLWLYDALSNQTSHLTFERNQPFLDQFYQSFHVDQYDYEAHCGLTDQNEVNDIDFTTLIEQLNQFFVIDVRESYEQPEWLIGPYLRIPLPRLQSMIHKIPIDQKICFICQKGIRSSQAIRFLQNEYGFNNLYNLRGGVNNII